MPNTRGAKRSVGSKGQRVPANDLPSVFNTVYGFRWSKLYQALANPTEHVALQNAFASGADLAKAAWKEDIAIGPIKAIMTAAPLSCWCCACLRSTAAVWQVCGHVHHEQSYSQPTPDPHTRLLSWYWLDRASLLPPLLLNPLPGQTVLDMCSAPGGKSLMLAYMLFAQKGPPTTALQTASSSHDHAHATPETSAHNNSTLTSFASTSPQHEPLSSNKTDGLPQDRRLSSQVESAAASAPHEQAASVLHLSQLQGSVRTDATDLAEHNALAEPGSVSEAACMPATLSAQHGQNVALCGSLTCNELDAARRSRLQGVLDAYLPAPLKRKVRYEGKTYIFITASARWNPLSSCNLVSRIIWKLSAISLTLLSGIQYPVHLPTGAENVSLLLLYTLFCAHCPLCIAALYACVKELLAHRQHLPHIINIRTASADQARTGCYVLLPDVTPASQQQV